MTATFGIELSKYPTIGVNTRKTWAGAGIEAYE